MRVKFIKKYQILINTKIEIFFSYIKVGIENGEKVRKKIEKKF